MREEDWVDPEIFPEGPLSKDESEVTAYSLIDGKWVKDDVDFSDDEMFEYVRKIRMVAYDQDGNKTQEISAADGGNLTIFFGKDKKLVFEVADKDVQKFLDEES